MHFDYTYYLIAQYRPNIIPFAINIKLTAIYSEVILINNQPILERAYFSSSLENESFRSGPYPVKQCRSNVVIKRVTSLYISRKFSYGAFNGRIFAVK